MFIQKQLWQWKCTLSPFLAATVLVALFQYTYIYSVYLNRKVNNILPISMDGSWLAHSFNKTAAVKFHLVFAGGWHKKQWGFIIQLECLQDSSRCHSTLQNKKVGPFLPYSMLLLCTVGPYWHKFLHNSAGSPKFRNIQVFSRALLRSIFPGKFNFCIFEFQLNC